MKKIMILKKQVNDININEKNIINLLKKIIKLLNQKIIFTNIYEANKKWNLFYKKRINKIEFEIEKVNKIFKGKINEIKLRKDIFYILGRIYLKTDMFFEKYE